MTKEKLDDPAAGWNDAPTDQDLLHQVLHQHPGLMDKVAVLDKSVLNYHGSFIAQALRAHHGSLEERVRHIRDHNREAFGD